jgi:hypothetical protein
VKTLSELLQEIAGQAPSFGEPVLSYLTKPYALILHHAEPADQPTP